MKKKLLLYGFTTVGVILTICSCTKDVLATSLSVKEALNVLSAYITSFVFFPISIQVGGMAQAVQLPIVVALLIGIALYFTFYFGFPNIKYLPLAARVLSGKYDNAPDKAAAKASGGDGEVSAFQALTTALSATVGLGNIAGVAIAISNGGPGATFWMMLAGFLGMSSKFVECTLGVKYREIDVNGKVSGGPMYYLKKGLATKKLGRLGGVFAWIYALVMIFAAITAGGMFQVNQATMQVIPIIANTMGIESQSIGLVFGIFMATMVGIVIIGGIKRIGKVAEKIVPTMVGIYILAALVILVLHFSSIDDAFVLIFKEAFNPSAVGGGVMGALVVGFTRGAFSNEAGLGSASFAHSTVKTQYPASEGMVALLEPFIDTIVVCTISALIIIITGTDCTVGSGIACTSAAFESVLPNFSLVLGLAAVLFAFSTMLAWSYYGLQAWNYLFKGNKNAGLIFQIIFCVAIVIGAIASLTAVVNIGTAMMFALVVPNMIGLLFLTPVVKEEVKRYVEAIRTGELDK